MGMVTFGIPQKITQELAILAGATVFIETGTYKGETACWAATCFDNVYTIENSEVLFGSTAPSLVGVPNIRALCGDSRDLLPVLLQEIGGLAAVHWLDSHWFGGDTGGEEDQCPLIGELLCLRHRAGDVILIDDARLFLAAPPMPHKPSLWPTILDIMRVLADFPVAPYVQIVDDVIFIVPDQPAIRAHLMAYCKRRSNKFWQSYQSWRAV